MWSGEYCRVIVLFKRALYARAVRLRVSGQIYLYQFSNFFFWRVSWTPFAVTSSSGKFWIILPAFISEFYENFCHCAGLGKIIDAYSPTSPVSGVRVNRFEWKMFLEKSSQNPIFLVLRHVTFFFLRSISREIQYRVYFYDFTFESIFHCWNPEWTITVESLNA